MFYKKVGRFQSIISPEERNRRQGAVRKLLKEKGLDCVMLYGNDIKQSGMLKYMSDSAGARYGIFFILSKDEDANAIFGHGPFGSKHNPNLEGIENNYGAPVVPTWNGDQNLFPAEAVRWLKRRGYKNLALYGKRTMPVNFVDYIMKNLPGATLAYLEDELDQIRAIKCQDEIDVLQKNTEMIERVYPLIPGFLKPGRLERDVANDIKEALWKDGCIEWAVSLGADKAKAAAKVFPMQNSEIKAGDVVDIYIQACNFSMYWAEIGRMWIVGAEPAAALVAAAKDTAEIQGKIAAMAKPGVKVATLLDELHKFQAAKGYKKEDLLFASGIGADTVERPAFFAEETMVLAENMTITIHPGLESDATRAFVADCFVIKADGAVRMSKLDQGVFRA